MISLPASLSEVWSAVATAEGNTGWLFPNEIDSQGLGTIWDPPHHFAVRQEFGEWFNALDFLIESSDANTSLLHYTHSGVIFENFEINNEAAQQHTDFYLHTLKEYLTHFKSRSATYIGGGPGGLQGSEASQSPNGFVLLKAALGLPSTIVRDQSYHITPEGIEAFEGVIDYNEVNFLGIRTSDALYRFFGRNAFGAPAGMSIHSFAENANQSSLTEIWQSWLTNAVS
ncbi:MAG: SRPBCC domain-containing protein [Actinomycetota bacterium]